MREFDNRDREEVYSQRVRAGKRTYFFDVKTTQRDDYYVSITESKKNFDGQFIKHKIFLYKEDFEKFTEGLNQTLDYIRANQDVVEKRYEDFVREEYSDQPSAAILDRSEPVAEVAADDTTEASDDTETGTVNFSI